ncbi:ATP-dependent helicase [Mycobacterium vicinigordonae]|uniref:DNA 3'-5' helicase n=1 Tax=Mycobacterium vicinigordonae TaxID=1719132 RepID=A0A7D6DZP0_9MYCO|nr:ATP-dependent DNA helicase [Mycobacterium vicinigordonae]QLL08624.1 ATP-dependent helicase [Mycobacterium vicinigordonae]
MSPRYTPAELADALGIFPPTDEQSAVIAAPPGPLVVIAGAGAGKTETMAARVVWLIANGYATADQVLGLTFTRKAAGQLLRRVRARVARLAALAIEGVEAAGTPAVSTYHAFAGSLLRDYGLLLPMEPDTRLLTETELWQLTFDVVTGYRGELRTTKTPAAVTSTLLRLWGQLAEHLVDTGQLRDTHVELERLVHTLPAGPRQRDTGPNQALLRMLSSQTVRAELVPLLDALQERLHAAKVMDFGMQMASAARLAAEFPQVGRELRTRYRVVLLDEYQDTGHSQRVALSALFGGGADDGLALTAVGDPTQSIYGWRGASATNLPRFTTDFPLSDGSPAPTLELRTSWRNPPTTLHLANAISAEARRRSVAVRPLRARSDATAGVVRCALLSDVRAERGWIADHIEQRYRLARDNGVAPPTTAVLVRRNADAAPIADVLRARGIPVEVVGLAGLLSIPEVADLVAMLRVVADPTAGSAAMRILSGPRWRLGGADLAALWRRARELAGGATESASAESIARRAGSDADTACLAEAICDPGPPAAYSSTGHQRISTLATELTALRGHLGYPLPDLVAEVRRTLGLDCEVRATAVAEWSGTEHLDAFADEVVGYAERASLSGTSTKASVAGLLAYLDAAAQVENGLAYAQPAVAKDRVQVLTVHAAKGLEWQVVAVAHLSGGIFPSTASRSSWLTDPGDLPPLLRGDRAGVGGLGIPVLDTSAVTNRKQLSDKISEHRAQLDRRRVDEERRLLYVGVTRAEDTLLVSGHHWGSAGIKPRGPSEFLCEIKEVIERSEQAGESCGIIEHWAPEPVDGERNPLQNNIIEAVWPAEPLGLRRTDVERGALLVSQAMAAMTESDTAAESGSAAHGVADPEGWIADVDALLAERARAAAVPQRALPSQLSVSGLVELARDPDNAVQRLIHRLPTRPDPHALLGNAFHSWVQKFYGAELLFDLGDLPGSADSDVSDPAELTALQAAFTESAWAARTPIAVEVPFEMPINDTVVRGRIDAVFADDDGGTTVVDWKTGEPPRGPEAMRQAAVQLAVYRLAWAALHGCPESSVRTAFHYVRSGTTVAPTELPDADELAVLLADANRAPGG